MASLNFKCPQCLGEVAVEGHAAGLSIACPHCQQVVNAPHLQGRVPPEDSAPFMERMSSHISRAAGVEQLESFSLQDMFSEVFAKHTDEEMERYFAVGGPDTTPSINEIDTSWPKPWVFFRVFVIAIIAYFAFVLAWEQFDNLNLVPGLIMVGSFAVPFATLILFFEINVRRNVSLFQVNKLVLTGGVLALIFSLLMFQFTDMLRLQWLGASVAGLVEEPGKLLALTLVVNRKKFPYILNGLLFGAAIGTGFAAFESAGYALRIALDGGSDAMKDTILMRGMLSPFGHIVWTAMSAAALWRVKGGAPFQTSMLNDMRFKRVFFVGVVLHMAWNTDVELPFHGKYIVLGLIAWVIIFGLIQEGLKQLRVEKAGLPSA